MRNNEPCNYLMYCALVIDVFVHARFLAMKYCHGQKHACCSLRSICCPVVVMSLIAIPLNAQAGNLQFSTHKLNSTSALRTNRTTIKGRIVKGWIIGHTIETVIASFDRTLMLRSTADSRTASDMLLLLALLRSKFLAFACTACSIV